MKRSRIEDLDKNLAPEAVSEATELHWLAATDRKFTIRGLPWLRENKGQLWRLPMRAEHAVRPPVWELGRCPASACLAFRSDTTDLAVRAVLSDAGIMPHMPVTGSNGLALYCGVPYRMRPWATALPSLESPAFEGQLFKDMPQKLREFRLYLPLYKPLEKLDLGLSRGARILSPSTPAFAKPVLFYGTSVTQGGCANTAGTDFVSTIGRLLNLDVINLGFSGNGKGEVEVAELLAEVDAGLYVLDYAANVSPAELRRTLPRFVRVLRAKRPDTPILLVTNILFSGDEYDDDARSTLEARRDIMMEFYLAQRKRGDHNVHFADGFGLLPSGKDAVFVDGIHPTDHGFALIAAQLSPAIERILLRDPGCAD